MMTAAKMSPADLNPRDLRAAQLRALDDALGARVDITRDGRVLVDNEDVTDVLAADISIECDDVVENCVARVLVTIQGGAWFLAPTEN
jgi:hypothetical protein